GRRRPGVVLVLVLSQEHGRPLLENRTRGRRAGAAGTAVRLRRPETWLRTPTCCLPRSRRCRARRSAVTPIATISRRSGSGSGVSAGRSAETRRSRARRGAPARAEARVPCDTAGSELPGGAPTRLCRGIGEAFVIQSAPA